MLEAWLERNEARRLWTYHDRNPSTEGFELRGYLIKLNVIIVQKWKGSGGWQIYVPSSRENNIEAALDGAACAIDCYGCRGLV